MAEWQSIMDVDSLAEGKIHAAEADGIALALVRTGTEIAAFLDVCPHEKHPLTQGEIQGDVIVCSKHLWEFDPASGEHISRIKRPECNLTKVPTRVIDGKLEVDVAELWG